MMDGEYNCLFNDCCGMGAKAPCCRFCEEQKECPEKCYRDDYMSCMWLEVKRGDGK